MRNLSLWTALLLFFPLSLWAQTTVPPSDSLQQKQQDKVVELEEVQIRFRRKSTTINRLNPLKTENLGEAELQKAACCNLSESFETSPSVDVSFTDAVSGTRQIQLLGLAGPYAQITRENIPNIRGLSALYGFYFVPGHWVESIQLNKGAGSVVNGFESVTGQINVELRKPETADRFFLNLYGSESGRVEGNLNLAHKLNDKWSTALLLHGKNNSVRQNRNGDGFLDMHLGTTLLGLNRWRFAGANGLRAQIGLQVSSMDNRSGQTLYAAHPDLPVEEAWRMTLQLNRVEAWAKIGKVFAHKPWQSMGLQLSGSLYEQKSRFGLRTYDADQQSLYANFVYQGIIGNTHHSFKTGASLQYDAYQEYLNKAPFFRKEIIPGAYFEYTYTFLTKFGLVAGLRADYHNLFGAFVTPRLHLRYELDEQTVLRASGGRGQRTASIFAENIGLMASSRQFIVRSEDTNKPYGLDAEVAWNLGLNLTRSFTLDYREGTVSFDFYRTQFQNQIVVDLDQNTQAVAFYNLDGLSYSNSFQAQADYELIKRLDLRLAYRWFDVKTTYNETLLSKPLIATHRAFMNLAYQTRNHWKFDYTLNWQGSKRIPFTGNNPVHFRLPEQSPAFFLMNAQISKTWREQFEVYLGGENLLNFRQHHPILSAQDPFSSYFDSSLIWGPIFGRNTYVGLRWKIK